MKLNSMFDILAFAKQTSSRWFNHQSWHLLLKKTRILYQRYFCLQLTNLTTNNLAICNGTLQFNNVTYEFNDLNKPNTRLWKWSKIIFRTFPVLLCRFSFLPLRVSSSVLFYSIVLIQGQPCCDQSTHLEPLLCLWQRSEFQAYIAVITMSSAWLSWW